MIRGIGTHIKAADFKKSVRFYKALGFKTVFEYGPSKKIQEAYSGIVFEHGGCKLEIADGHRAVKSEVFANKMETSKVSLMIYVDSLKEIIKRAEDANIPLAVGPRHYYWETLEVVIKDPDGVVLVFIEPYNEASAKDLGADEAWATKPS